MAAMVVRRLLLAMSRPSLSSISWRTGARLGGAALLFIGCSRSEAATRPAETTGAATVPIPSASPLSPSGASPTPGTQPPPASVSAEAKAGPSDSPPVNAAGTPPEPAGKRVYAKTRYVWIRGTPDGSVQWIGYLWHGGSVAVKEDRPIVGNGCATWYAIEPRGYVCVDGEKATFDASDPEYVEVAKYSPDVSQPWPHRYAESLGAERYPALPTEGEQRRREPNFEDRMARIAAARRGAPLDPMFEGIDFSPGPDDPIEFSSLPPKLQIARNYLKPESTIAYTKAVEHAGRTFLLTADMTWLPKDRSRPYPKIEFSGVHLKGAGGPHLPVAFIRKEDRDKYRRTPEGRFEKADGAFRRLSWVQLTGNSETSGDEEYLETDAGDWIRADQAVVPNPGPKTPWGAELGKPDTTGHQPDGRKTWVEISVLGGWLVAFEGTLPVFTTMISPGRGGIPVEGKPPVTTASTPTGRFHVTGKFATANMETTSEFIHSDVPWTQNFSGPHALHTAYWHDDWGQLKSGGCVNVSPRDGKWLYDFTDPPVPEGWHGVRWNPKAEPSTALVIHR